MELIAHSMPTPVGSAPPARFWMPSSQPSPGETVLYSPATFAFILHAYQLCIDGFACRILAEK